MGYFLKRVDKIIRDSWLQNQSIPDSSLKSNIEQQKYKGAKKNEQVPKSHMVEDHK